MIRTFSLGLIIVVLLLTIQRSEAQSNDWRNYIEQLAEEEMDDMSIENMFEELSQLEQSPMNLNSVTRDELELFPLISLNQANAIADFLERTGLFTQSLNYAMCICWIIQQ